jgi:LmbE family N-acetylglucosaminyl deacetylase
MMLKNNNLKRVLATGAHFDDVEVGVGGTLLKHAENGDEIYISIMESDEFRTGEAKIRLKEQKRSFKLLGIDKYHYIFFKSADKYPNIVTVLDRFKPDIIYTPYENDTHQAHRKCSKISQSVGRKINITTIFYYCGSSINFNPNLFSIIDFEKKLELIKCHESQIELGALKLNIRKKMEAYWASLVSEDDNCYAEGLIIKKMIYGV